MSKSSTPSQANKKRAMCALPHLELSHLGLPDRLCQRREDERLLRGRGGITRAWLPVDPCCCGPCEYIGLIQSYGAQAIHWQAAGGIEVSAPPHADNDPRCTEGAMDFSILEGTEEQTLSASGTFSGGDHVRCGYTPYECQSDWHLWWSISCDAEAETWRLSVNAYHSAYFCFDSPCHYLGYLYYSGETPIDLTIDDDGRVTGSYTVELAPEEEGYQCPEGCEDICDHEPITLTVEFNP